jgi:hypothetical protein
MGLVVAAVAGVLLLLGARFLWGRWRRSTFIKQLSPAEREHLRAFEIFKGNWRDFKDLRQTLQYHPRD